MTIQILSQTDRSLRASCGNKTASVFKSTSGDVWVFCINDSHRGIFRLGKSFPSFHAAVEAYKSGEMKAILRLAQEKITTSAE